MFVHVCVHASACVRECVCAHACMCVCMLVFVCACICTHFCLHSQKSDFSISQQNFTVQEKIKVIFLFMYL